MTQTIEAVFAKTTSIVQVAAAMGGAGQALPTTPSSSVDLACGSIGGPVEYKVGSGAWITLDRHQGVTLNIDLSTTAVLVRKASTASAAVAVALSINTLKTSQVGEANVPAIIVGSGAPSNSDGRPDGTVYIQTA